MHSEISNICSAFDLANSRELSDVVIVYKCDMFYMFIYLSMLPTTRGSAVNVNHCKSEFLKKCLTVYVGSVT